MKREIKKLDEISLMLENLSKLDTVLRNLANERDGKDVWKKIFMASLLIEKIIFYYQLSRGVGSIGIYKYSYPDQDDVNPDVRDIYKFYKKLRLNESISLSKLIRLRNMIAKVYMKYIRYRGNNE